MLETLKDVTTRQDAERAQAKLAVEEASKKLSQLHVRTPPSLSWR